MYEICLFPKSVKVSRFSDWGINGRGENNFELRGIVDSRQPQNNAMFFFNKMDEEQLSILEKLEQTVIILPESVPDEDILNLSRHNFVIMRAKPRYEYSRILDLILRRIGEYKTDYKLIRDGVWADRDVTIASSAVIEPLVRIGKLVTVGENCRIMSGAVIGPRVTIGNETVIRENAVVGGYGFGMAKGDEFYIRLPHIGGVIIGNNVEIGALTTVCSGTINPTIVEDHVKVDDHVHIGHNSRVGYGTIITACAEIGASLKIGKDVWVGPNVCIREKCDIGDHAFIGIGSVVVKSVKSGAVVMGNPAVERELFLKIREAQKKQVKD